MHVLGDCSAIQESENVFFRGDIKGSSFLRQMWCIGWTGIWIVGGCAVRRFKWAHVFKALCYSA